MPDLGTKHECTECGAKFYDLNKPEPTCPKCGTVQPPDAESSLGTSKSAKKRQKAELIAESDLDDDEDGGEVFAGDLDDEDPDEDDELDEEALEAFSGEDDEFEDEEEEEELDDD
jgi:hypothetical protein